MVIALLGNLVTMVEVGRYDLRGLFRWIVKYLSDKNHPHTYAVALHPSSGGEV